ncbi:SMP-30/gluconolactonase/LRE family protein [Paramicrobacterium agarici]|uniref:Sugar lactone lactonase YvrE n=1 Tax=Paramicrobacterium agarici TaxID=630514 RepID=A0A2A9DTI6_9MICO|nr:SMP-30/gluconolactonase/LRE family protein [Microbacterium agarici]PFG30008.1 sugar lactone lactonase YvrE [Microbacterium agarici]
MKAHALGGPVAWHGEGPVWDSAGGRLLIVDMTAGVVVDLGSPEQEPEAAARHDVGSTVAAALRPRASGGFVVATEHGFSLFSRDFTRERRFDDVITDDGIRMNDGGCDPQGRFYCGTMAYDAEPGRGELFRLDADGSTRRIFGGVTISNGLQWSEDGTLAYYNDTPTGRIDVFDFDGDQGTFENRRPFVILDEGVGTPDGLTVDAEGGVWVALWGGSAVRRYDSDGGLSEVVEVPGVTNTSACCFGGTDLRTLFITTSREGVAEGDQPAAGAVFAVNPGVAGRPLPVFAG